MHRRQGRDTVEPLNPPAATKYPKNRANPDKTPSQNHRPIAQEPFPDPISAISLFKKS